MGDHFISKCEHGVVVAQCRCPSPNKSVRIVPCPPTCDVARAWEEVDGQGSD